MYTEKSVILKADFYCRYGETSGKLWFERTGLPCTLLESQTHMLAFSLDCGVRAYGRGYGDVMRVLNADSSVCDGHFVENGKGAQILYRTDISDIKGMREVEDYTINKLLYNMGSSGRVGGDTSLVGMCDKYAPNGWCLVKENDSAHSLPLPISRYNVLLIRVRKTRFTSDKAGLIQFSASETKRIKAAAAALKECREEVLFEMINESQASIERTFSPPPASVCAAAAAMESGALAARICDIGIIAFSYKSDTDSIARAVHTQFEREIGYRPAISVVK